MDHLPKLLLVEDDETIRALLAKAVEKSQAFDLLAAVCDGQAALDLISEGLQPGAARPLPDAILSDLKMPRVDGIELVRALKARMETRGIPIAIVTSSDEPNDRNRAMDAGCCAFLRKPTGMNALIAVIQVVAEKALASRTGRAAEVPANDPEPPLAPDAQMSMLLPPQAQVS